MELLQAVAVLEALGAVEALGAMMAMGATEVMGATRATEAMGVADMAAGTEATGTSTATVSPARPPSIHGVQCCICPLSPQVAPLLFYHHMQNKPFSPYLGCGKAAS